MILMAQLIPPSTTTPTASLIFFGGWNLRLGVHCYLAEERQFGTYHWTRICPVPCEFSVSVSPLPWRGVKSESAGWCQQWCRHIVMVRSGCLPFCIKETCVVSKRPCRPHCVLITGSRSTGRKEKVMKGVYLTVSSSLKCVCAALGHKIIEEFLKLFQWIFFFLHIILNQFGRRFKRSEGIFHVINDGRGWGFFHLGHWTITLCTKIPCFQTLCRSDLTWCLS